MNYYEHRGQKNDAELCAEHPGIEPEWTRGHVLAEQVMEKFKAEHFEPLAKLATDYVGDKLWDLLRDHLIQDTEENVAGYVRDRIESTVRALLTGEKWALDRYVLEARNYQHGQEIRAAIARLIPAELQAARVVDLEAQVAKLEEDLQQERSWNRRGF